MKTFKDTESLKVVIGAGPLGQAVANALAAEGRRVKLVSRSAARLDLPGVECANADATDVGALAAELAGAQVVYHCANAPYHRWPQELPEIWSGILTATAEAGAKLVIGSNLYAYGAPSGPMTADEAFAPCTRKGRVRARLEQEALDAHAAGKLQVAIVRASDFYGPGTKDSMLGARFFDALSAGKKPTLFGKRGMPHSYTYLPDFARAMVAVGTSADESVYGRSWIVPTDSAVTVEQIEAVLAGLGYTSGVGLMGKPMVRFGGLFVPAAREMVEMMYEFERPFVVDSRETEDRFSLTPTPFAEALAQTARWYEHRGQEQSTHGKGTTRTDSAEATLKRGA